MEVAVTTANSYILECFASPTRIKIIELLKLAPMNIKQLSQSLDIKPPIVTRHIQMLEAAGIVGSELIAGQRGQQKRCFLQLDKMMLDFTLPQQQPILDITANQGKRYEIDVPVGMYAAFDVKPSCGLASQTTMLGMCDDPRYFADPIHRDASIVWFSSGYVEYRIPNYMIYNDQLLAIEVALEICSETPCSSSQMLPSDIVFNINGTVIGEWTYSGRFGKEPGVFTPSWWHKDIKHGIMKHVRVTEVGSFIDGVQLSDVTISDLNIVCDKEIFLKISCSSDAKNCGGVTIFGEGFGNYDQHIQVALQCK